MIVILYEVKWLEGFGLEKQVRKFGLTKTFHFGLGLVDKWNKSFETFCQSV